MQTEEDRDRLLALGVPAGRVTVTGNLKYESPEPARQPELEAALARLAAGRRSSSPARPWPGEEEQVLDAFARLGGGERALLVLAPRHPERWDEVDRLLAGRGLASVRRSRIWRRRPPKSGDGRSAGRCPGDSRSAGGCPGDGRGSGRLAPRQPGRARRALPHGRRRLHRRHPGAHRRAQPPGAGPLRRAGRGRALDAQLPRHGRALRPRRGLAPGGGAGELAAAWGRWLDDPAAAREEGGRAARLVEENRGAVARTLELLAPVLARVTGRAGGRVGRGGGAGGAERLMRLEAPPPPASPWQLLYGGAHRLRRRWYRERARRLPRPVVSVGNLHWGGAGKTPLVAALAAHLRDRGLAVCILSRGYASRGRGVRVVSAGEGRSWGRSSRATSRCCSPASCPGVPVVVGPDRHHAGLHALRRLTPEESGDAGRGARPHGEIRGDHHRHAAQHPGEEHGWCQSRRRAARAPALTTRTPRPRLAYPRDSTRDRRTAVAEVGGRRYQRGLPVLPVQVADAHHRA